MSANALIQGLFGPKNKKEKKEQLARPLLGLDKDAQPQGSAGNGASFSFDTRTPVQPLDLDLSGSKSSRRAREEKFADSNSTSRASRSNSRRVRQIALASVLGVPLGAQREKEFRLSCSRLTFYSCNFLTTGINTIYVTSHFFTKISGLNSTFLKVSPWAILMSMPLVIFFSYSEARSHDAQSRQLHEGNATAIAEMQKSFLDRFKALRTRRKLCLVTYFISHVFSDIQSLLLIAQLADFTELKPGLLAMVYLLMGGYGAVANTQEVSNTLISFEGEAQFSTSAPLSCSRIGFYMSNSVITAINTFYVCSHFLTNLDSLIDYDFFQPSFLGISAGALTLSLIPVLSFSYAEAKAADAQSQQLTEESESTSSSSSGLTFFERFKRLSMEQKFCVFGHLFSDVFSDIQCLVLLLNLSDVEDHVPFWALSLLYVAMFAYGFVTDYQVVPNTIAGFESENGPRYALIRAASDLSMAENGNGHPKGLGSDSDEERKPQKMEDAEHELSS